MIVNVQKLMGVREEAESMQMCLMLMAKEPTERDFSVTLTTRNDTGNDDHY